MSSMLGGGFGMRTIWITLRAINYTSRIFNEIIKDIGKLIGREMELNKAQKEAMKAATQFVSAGLLLTTMAVMQAQSIFNMALATKKGAMEMAQLQSEMEAVKIALADTAYDFLKAIGILALFHGMLNTIKENPALRIVVIGLLALTAILTALVGVAFLYAGAMRAAAIWTQVLGVESLKAIPALIKQKLAVDGLAISWQTVAAAMLAAVGTFALIVMITQRFGGLVGVIAGVTIAILGLAAAIAILKGVLSLGGTVANDIATMAALGAAFGGVAGAIYAGSSGFAMGTRAVPFTGYAPVHKGEVIFNPATGRPTQIGNDLRGGEAISTVYDTDIIIEQLHIRSDIDDVDEKLGRRLWRTAKGRR